MMRWLIFLFLLSACTAPMPQAAAPTAAATPMLSVPMTPPVATRDPQATPRPIPTFSAPTVSPGERQATTSTWLYLTAFQSGNVSVIDPRSGHALREFPVTGDQAGMVVSPDGTRLYIVDGWADGELRIYDTSNWQVIHREPIANRAALLGGNPIALSGDGRWLIVGRHDFKTNQSWSSVFDTQQMRWLTDNILQSLRCRQADILPLRFVGQTDRPYLYADCKGSVIAVDAITLLPQWREPAPTARAPSLVVSPDGKRLYGLYPQIAISYASGSGRVTLTDLWLSVWETRTFRGSANALLVQQIRLSDRVSVPLHTSGRGEGGYLAISPDGARLYVAWEDRLWSLASDSLQVTGELQMPTPTDGLAMSVDGRELYLLPSNSGNLRVRETGLWTVDAATLKLIRHADDWRPLGLPFFFAVPAR